MPVGCIVASVAKSVKSRIQKALQIHPTHAGGGRYVTHAGGDGVLSCTWSWQFPIRRRGVNAHQALPPGLARGMRKYRSGSVQDIASRIRGIVSSAGRCQMLAPFSHPRAFRQPLAGKTIHHTVRLTSSSSELSHLCAPVHAPQPPRPRFISPFEYQRCSSPRFHGLTMRNPAWAPTSRSQTRLGRRQNRESHSRRDRHLHFLRGS